MDLNNSRSVSIPRTRLRQTYQVHSDSQVRYHVPVCVTETDSAGSESSMTRSLPRKVKLSRSKRVSRSFALAYRNTDNIDKIRRCSTPLHYNNVFNDRDTNVGSLTCPANSVTAALLLAHQSLKLSCPLLPTPPVPAPLVVEDPPSSDNASDLEEDTVRFIEPVLLNGSSGNFGASSTSSSSSAAAAAAAAAASGSSYIGVRGSASSAASGVAVRSAPSTPHGVVALGSAGVALAGALQTHEPHSQPASPSYNLVHKSPSHVFTKYEKGGLKQLSSSAPIMTAQARSPEPPSPKVGKGEKMPAGTSKARQKKFHRHFTQVDDDERVLNYYSCALVGDILLQGHLYITKNYFAFYSNVFGYVTKLLIPISSVLKISKEKTARIIPNAVGVATAEDKHVFGSLLSRDSTYKLMTMVLKAATNEAAANILPPPQDLRPGELDAPSEFSLEDDSSSQSGNECSPSGPRRRGPSSTHTQTDPTPVATPQRASPPLAKYNVFLLVSTLLLLLLFASAGVLLYRISRIQYKYIGGSQELQPSVDIYNEILHWQSQLHTKSAGAVHNFLDTNLDQIAKVRKSLEALSTLLMPSSQAAAKADAATDPS